MLQEIDVEPVAQVGVLGNEVDGVELHLYLVSAVPSETEEGRGHQQDDDLKAMVIVIE